MWYFITGLNKSRIWPLVHAHTRVCSKHIPLLPLRGTGFELGFSCVCQIKTESFFKKWEKKMYSHSHQLYKVLKIAYFVQRDVVSMKKLWNYILGKFIPYFSHGNNCFVLYNPWINSLWNSDMRKSDLEPSLGKLIKREYAMCSSLISECM